MAYGHCSLRANPAMKTNPRGNARNVIFFELAGALSHVDSFDFKENPSTLQGVRRSQDARTACMCRTACSRACPT